MGEPKKVDPNVKKDHTPVFNSNFETGEVVIENPSGWNKGKIYHYRKLSEI